MPSTEAPVSEMTVTFAGGTCTTDNPMSLQAGEMTVNLDVKDQDKSSYALMVFNLDAGKDFADLMASTVGLPPSWSHTLLFEELGPGGTQLDPRFGPVLLELDFGEQGAFAQRGVDG